MLQKERTDAILAILQENGYVPVKLLVEKLHYSNATINRDLNLMQKQSLVKRSYGGVEIVKTKGVRLPFRYHKMKTVKTLLSKKAAEMVNGGDVIFIDGTTTTEYMGHFLEDKKDITVITNNMALVMHLAEMQIKTVCLGGSVVEAPFMLCGTDTVENASRYHADKFFFSSGKVSRSGLIDDSQAYGDMHRKMMENSDRVIYLADHEKLGDVKGKAFSLSDIDVAITDFEFDDKVKGKFPQVEFVEI